MALKPNSAFSKKGAPAAGSPSIRPTRPSSSGGGGNGTMMIVFFIVVAVGALIFFLVRNSDQQKLEAARQAEENKKILAENKARAAEQERKAAEEKAAKKARREAAAKEAAEAAEKARQEQENQTVEPEDATPSEPEPEETTEPAGDDSATEEPTEEPADESGEGEGGDDGEDGAEPAEGELDVAATDDADKENVKRLRAMARKAAESGEYEDFAQLLKTKLEAAYPSNMAAKDGLLPTAISKSLVGEEARCLYIGLLLAQTNADAASAKGQEAFMKWLLGDKMRPAVTFVKSLAKYKVTEKADAVDMMDELRTAYTEEPKKAFSKIKSIANPIAHSVSKKLYPHAKKDIATTINKLKNAKQKGTLNADQRDAVNLVNVYRYLCGLPANVVYDSTYEKEAAEAARACKAAGHIAHDLGHFTDKCNLFAGISGPPVQTVSGYISDNGANNREARGHRAWILFAGTGKTAFGKDGSYQAMRTLDNSSGYKPKTAWSYPGRGFFPLEYLHGTGWSYYCAPGTAMPASESDVKVEMWSVPKGLKKAPASSRLTKGTSIPVLNIYAHLGGYMPTGHTIVFEPDYSKMKPQDNKPTGTYWVRISWPGYKDEYVVEFY